MNENYDFADLSGKYYAMKNKLLKVIKAILIDANSNIRNPPIEKKVYMCPVHRNLWVKGGKKGEVIPMYYTWNRVCPDCFDKFHKMDTIEMIELFPLLRDML